jgi:excisionase family DNA binding protein
VPVDHVYKLAREQRIPHLKFGRSLRFRFEAITRWLEDDERGNERLAAENTPDGCSKDATDRRAMGGAFPNLEDGSLAAETRCV